MRVSADIEWAKHLTANEQKAVTAFLKIIKDDYRYFIDRVIFYGSKARGDWHEESDIDLLIVFSNSDRRLWRDAFDHLIDAGLDNSIYLLSIKMRDEEWLENSKKIGTPFFRELDREGIVLWKNQISKESL